MVSNEDFIEARIHKWVYVVYFGCKHSPASLFTCCYDQTTHIHAQGTAKARLPQLKLVSCSLQEKEDFRADLVTSTYITGNLVPKLYSAGSSGNCSYMTIGKAQAPL